jgi:hypothetical protein
MEGFYRHGEYKPVLSFMTDDKRLIGRESLFPKMSKIKETGMTFKAGI